MTSLWYKRKLTVIVLCLFSVALLFPAKAYAISVPEMPKNLTISVSGSNDITVRWDAVDYASHYYVFRGTSLDGLYIMLSMPSATTYTDTNLSSGTTYYYKVQAVNSAGTSNPTAVIYATTDSFNVVLTAPSNITATSISGSQISLAWSPVGAATSYNVYRAPSASGNYAHIASVTTANFTDSGLTANATYYYKIQSSGGTGLSPNSNAVSATVNIADTVPAPTGLQALSAGDTQISLTWNAVSSATYYMIYRATASTGPYFSLGSTATANYIDINATQGTTYYYKIQAANNTGESVDSAIVSATAGTTNDTNANAELTAPANLIARATGSDQIYLSWDAVGSATYYTVYRASSPSGNYTGVATLTTPNYTDADLTANTGYYYKIQAGNPSSLSPFSTVSYGTTDPADGSNPTLPGASGYVQSERLAGEDRYATAAELAKSGWNTSYYAIIVSGENFADALCSAPLANKHNAPILLTSKDVLNDYTRTELSRLKVKNVIIIGGTGIISANVEQSVKNMDIEVSRIAGIDRYETSLKVAQALGQSNQAVVACGQSFPDALSIAPIAALKGMPIILTPADKLPENVRTYLTQNVQSTYVVGGTGVVSDSVFQQLPSPIRLSGFSRYETNVRILEEFAGELDFSTCYVATGEQYADALAGAALASLTSSPVILVSNPVDSSTLNFIAGVLSKINKEVIFGGTVVVPQSVIGSGE